MSGNKTDAQVYSPQQYSRSADEENVDRPTTSVSRGNVSEMISQLTSNQHSMTVDPSQIFNPLEYQRRKQATEAEAQAAKDAGQRRLQEKLQKAQSNIAETPIGDGNVRPSDVAFRPGQAHPSTSSDPAGGEKDEPKQQKEANLRALFGSMFNHMRELKAEDPAMFLEIWEDFKKVCSPRFSNELSYKQRCSIPRYYLGHDCYVD